MRRSIALLLALASLLILPPAAFATGALDQEQTDAFTGIQNVTLAQTFTAGKTGLLDTASLHAVVSLSGMTVEIRTTSLGQPTAAVLASGTITSSATGGWVDVTFPSPASVVTGTQYALVATLGDGIIGLTSAGGYAGGSMWEVQSGTWVDDAAFDIAFRTYVTAVVAPNGPGVWRSNAALTTSLLPQTLGTYEVSTYLRARAIFDASKCGKPNGSAVNCIAGQLLATKLSISNGADGSCIDAAVTQADLLLTQFTYHGPGTYSPSKADRNSVIAVQKMLSAYNVGGCAALIP